MEKLTDTWKITKADIHTYTDFYGEPQQELLVDLKLSVPQKNVRLLRHPVSDVYLRVSPQKLYVRIPLYDGMARLYYEGYENYEYLPSEDMAVHKSIAAAVSRAHRKKATPATCYTRVAVTEAFLQSTQLREYVSHILRSFSAFDKEE